MPRKQEAKWNLEELSDAEICAAIRYLDPGPISEMNGENNSARLVVCVSLLALLLGCIGFIWIYFRVLGQ